MIPLSPRPTTRLQDLSYESRLLRQAYKFITSEQYWYMDPSIVDWVLSVECHGTVADRQSRAAPFLVICEDMVTTVEFNFYPNSKLRRAMRRSGFTCGDNVKIWTAGPAASFNVYKRLERLPMLELNRLDMIDPPRFGA